MTVPRRITNFLNIQPEEERLVGSLILLYLTLAMGFVFVQSMAFGVFIGEYGARGLPYSYIVVAIFASLVAFLYIKLNERVSFTNALKINIASLGFISFLVWLGLKSPFAHTVAFTLPLLFQIVVNMGNLAIWSLAGRLFDFRQGKRLFPLLGAGLWAANTVGGLLVTPLVAWMGAVNLLLLAVTSIGLAFLVLRTITKTFLQETTPPAQPRKTTRPRQGRTGFFKDRYILLIFAYIILWWVAFFFLDNIFYDRAAARFPDVDQLTAFTGQLLSIMGLVAFIFSTFLTGRIISRLGLRVALVAMPLIVIIALGTLAAGGTMGAALAFTFAAGTFAKVTNVSLGFSLSQSANAIVYQSLTDNIRRRVQATAEGVMQPVAIGIAGLSLLALTTGLKLDYTGLSVVFLGVGLAWLSVIFLLSGNYIKALTQAITRRRFGDSPNVPADPATIAILRERLHDSHPGVSIFALTKLEALDQGSLTDELPRLVQHPASEVRREAFARIEGWKLHDTLSSVREQLSLESIPQVKEYALRALGAIADDDSVAHLASFLNETEPYTLRGALVGLLKSREEPAAERRLACLLGSSSPDDRILAAQVLGEVNRDRFHKAHQSLLQDVNPEVRREALESAGKIRQLSLVPLIIESCDSPETSRVASLALASIGPKVLPAIESAFSETSVSRERQLTLVKVLGRIGGEGAQALLRAQMDLPDSELRSHVLNALSQSGFRFKETSKVMSAIESEIQQAIWVCASQVLLGDTNETALLYAALGQEFDRARERVLLLLSFGFDADSILRTRDAFLTGSVEQRSYALEIVDLQLPSEFKGLVVPLFEDTSPQEYIQRFAKDFPQTQATSEERLRALIENGHFIPWTRACAIYTAVQLSWRACLDAIKISTTDSDSLVSETACWASTHLESNSSKGRTAMLSMIEKVIILKTVNIFSQTPDDVLADVANLLDEADAAEGETIFEQGDLGDSMYIIVDGKVKVHDNGRLLNYLGERDVFGEMALLDPEPRIASVTAVEPARLFRLDQAPFYELIAERPEVATGIIRVLTGHLRNRVRDIALLDARVKELENRLSEK